MKVPAFFTSCAFFTFTCLSSFGAITLTNGDFSNGMTGWSATPHNWISGGTYFDTPFSVTGGWAKSTTGTCGFQQRASDAPLSFSTITFDFRIDATGSRNLDMRLFNSTLLTGANTISTNPEAEALSFRVSSTGMLELYLGGSSIAMNNLTTALAVGVEYTFSLQLSGMDGNGGATAAFGGSVTDKSTSISQSFSATGAMPNMQPWDTISFRHGAWGSEQYSLDNIVVVPEPSMALLGGMGAFLLLRRRRS